MLQGCTLQHVFVAILIRDLKKEPKKQQVQNEVNNFCGEANSLSHY